jgi:diguanylate cyclase (GGDEF)-like protein/putative nucleotidyltransferase with HDIG domain
MGQVAMHQAYESAHILLVEDDPGHQELVRSALQDGRPHVRVHVASSGSDAADIIEEHTAARYDCVILDYSLPDCTAPELLRDLAELGVNCPQVVISSSRSQDIVIESMRSGSVDFVPKQDAVLGNMLWDRIALAMHEHRHRERSRRNRERRQRHLVQLAELDPLTGLSNRRVVDELFNDRRRTWERRGEGSIILLDLDHFKRVNDEYGHAVGDRVLQAAAQAMRTVASNGDIACRWGGEEFIIVLRGRGYAEAVAAAEALRRRLAAESIRTESGILRVTASVGVTSFQSNEFRKDLIKQADQAMYEAKHLGRNRVVTWLHAVFRRLSRLPSVTRADRVTERLNAVLDAWELPFGPTQREHLTEHSIRVARVAHKLGTAMRLDANELRTLVTASLCHDIGKLLIPESVLAKRECLTTTERALINRHGQDGADMALDLGADEATACAIRHHHTRFDSYKGTDLECTLGPIPRILAVADSLVAMTSERTYQLRRSVNSALAELRCCHGGQFDPEVISVLPNALKDSDFADLVVRPAPIEMGSVLAAGAAG